MCFYVSPFLRSRQTYEQIRQSFHDEQVQCGTTLFPAKPDDLESIIACLKYAYLVFEGDPCARGPPYQGTGVGEFSEPLKYGGGHGGEKEGGLLLLQVSHRGKVSVELSLSVSFTPCYVMQWSRCV